jgi:hypothetical protein
MEITYVNQKGFTFLHKQIRVLVILTTHTRLKAEFLLIDDGWSTILMYASIRRFVIVEPRGNSSGFYICKSVVNYLRHGNYICKSEGNYIPTERIREGAGDVRAKLYLFQWSVHM